MLVAVFLLQIAKRLSLPYPAMLAGAGVLIAFIPGMPVIPIQPETYLALFIAPVLVDAAYDFPPGSVRRFVAPLLVDVVLAVLLTAGVVAWISVTLLGMPWAAGIALGAIVAPPDAAAASAVLRGLPIPTNVQAVLQGESLFNDSTALLLFSSALAVLTHHGLSTGISLRLIAAVPGGILFGLVCAILARYTSRLLGGTLGGNLFQFIMSFAVWIIASRLELSAVLATVAFAMSLAHRMDPTTSDTRMRVQSYAVWSAVVFGLNVFAFVLMGMQARLIVGRMDLARLHTATIFAGVVILSVILVRMFVVLGFHSFYGRWERAKGRQPASWREVTFVGWCGMRGFITMAITLSLPEAFPQRDIVVLTAFAVVLVTLVVQGVTIVPLVRALGLDTTELARRQLDDARVSLASAALASLGTQDDAAAQNLRYKFELHVQQTEEADLRRLRKLGLGAVRAERRQLEQLRSLNKISTEDYLNLQERLDWSELTMLPDDQRTIEEV